MAYPTVFSFDTLLSLLVPSPITSSETARAQIYHVVVAVIFFFFSVAFFSISTTSEVSAEPAGQVGHIVFESRQSRRRGQRGQRLWVGLDEETHRRQWENHLLELRLGRSQELQRLREAQRLEEQQRRNEELLLAQQLEERQRQVQGLLQTQSMLLERRRLREDVWSRVWVELLPKKPRWRRWADKVISLMKILLWLLKLLFFLLRWILWALWSFSPREFWSGWIHTPITQKVANPWSFLQSRPPPRLPPTPPRIPQVFKAPQQELAGVQNLATETRTVLELLSEKLSAGSAERELAHTALDNLLIMVMELKSHSAQVSPETHRLEEEKNFFLDAACVVCCAAVSDTIVMPCKHLAVCGTCCDKMGMTGKDWKKHKVQCPICRTDVVRRMKIYRS